MKVEVRFNRRAYRVLIDVFFLQADQLTEEQIAGKTWSIDHRSALLLLAASLLDLSSHWIYTFAF